MIRSPNNPFHMTRLRVFQGVVVGVFLLFALRLYALQIVGYSDAQAQADENRLNEQPLPADRGAIFDRNGVVMARNVPAFNIEIVPAFLPDTEEATLAIYNRLSALLDVPPTIAIAEASGRANIRSIEQLVDEGQRLAPFRPVVIAQDVDRLVAMQIYEERLTMPGVDVRAVGVREYPTGAETAHIVGYMGPIPAEEAEALIEQGYNPAFDRIGYEGVEYFLESQLAGQRGVVRRIVDVAGEEIQPLERIDPVPGTNVRLTIDVELQQAATQALANGIARYNEFVGFQASQSGVVIAMNPQTGEILAMVSLPTYDNTEFARAINGEYYLQVLNDPLRPLVNNAIKGLFPPGSVWKVITAMGALEEGVINPQTRLLDEGLLSVENRYAPNDPAASQTFVCWRDGGHGMVDLLGALAQSCNVYFYQVGGGNANLNPTLLREGGLGIDALFRYASAVGIGTELGVELPGEVAGRMPDEDWKRRNYGENWSTGDTYNASLGQGYVLVTPLQLITAVSSVANGGTIYQPTVIDAFLDAEGNVTQDFQPQVSRTLNIDNIPADQPITLTMVEDMLIRGPDSLVCRCENRADNPNYNATRCNPTTYTAEADVNPDEYVTEMRSYTVHVPYGYVFNGAVCQDVRYNRTIRNDLDGYNPAFVSTPNIDIVRTGTRLAVTVGTAGGDPGPGGGADLPYVETAGKTGTAEYCDDVAFPLGLCEFGAWPAHAWFAGYLPYENPQLLVIAFVYNGDEGSRWAVPIAVEVMEAYCRLQEQRGNSVCRPTTP